MSEARARAHRDRFGLPLTTSSEADPAAYPAAQPVVLPLAEGAKPHRIAVDAAQEGKQLHVA